jgi:tRNA threonylcarbamoyladenosine modification (KEOPS) complex  Pcc1 subunit
MRAVITYEGAGAGVIRDALRPEAGREIPRAQVSVHGEGDRVVIDVETDDTPALRAALNSYLRWAQVALDVSRAVSA